MNKYDQNFAAQKIRSQYTKKEGTELDLLRALDRKVKKPANIFAYIFGCAGAVIMGSGMSLVMTEIGETLGMSNTMIPGIIIGIIGMIMIISNYSIYKVFLNYRKKKYRSKILELSERIINK